MAQTRLIARLDVKGPRLVKGIHLEGFRFLGNPQEYAERYYREGIDELLYLDAVASLYGRESLIEVVRNTVRHVFVPITVGGGVRSVDDAAELLRAGADKIAVNTAAVRNPQLISDIARRFGSQCMVLSVDVRRRPTTSGEGVAWEVYVENGRDRTGMDAITWIREGIKLGAGELLLTSIDREGTTKGFDIDLMKAVSQEISIPLIASGGMGTSEHLIRVVKEGGVDAVAIAGVLHRNQLSLSEIRRDAVLNGVAVRMPDQTM